MAISVDTVYQRVLALANKEQRGYITPQEFNLFANQAQMDIFEQYFYDLNQFLRVPGNDTIFADMSTLLREKIDLFIKSTTITGGSNTIDLPTDSYRVARVGAEGVEVERMTNREFNDVRIAPLTKPTLKRPAYYQKDTRIIIHPNTIDTANIVYIRKPLKVDWTYVVVGGKALVNNNDPRYQDFELHPSEETDLIIKILTLAGVTLKDLGLVQLAGTEEARNIQQEKL